MSEFDRWERILILGEDNPHTRGERGRAFAFYHLPRRASGNRLRRIMGLRDHQYEKIVKTNLCIDRWSAPAAREYYREVVVPTLPDYDAVICCGAKVRDAAGLEDLCCPGVRGVYSSLNNRLTRLVLLPHPSGRSRAWNREDTVMTCRAALRVALPDVPWGTAPDALPGIRK